MRGGLRAQQSSLQVRQVKAFFMLVASERMPAFYS